MRGLSSLVRRSSSQLKDFLRCVRAMRIKKPPADASGLIVISSPTRISGKLSAGDIAIKMGRPIVMAIKNRPEAAYLRAQIEA